MIKKILTHWTSSLFTLAILAIIGFSNPDFKEIIKLKSFDFLLASEEQTFSEDIVIVEIDEVVNNSLSLLYCNETLLSVKN